MSACAFCDSGTFRLGPDHVRVSDQGVETLGRCTAEDEVIRVPVDAALARLHAVTTRLREGASTRAAAEILARTHLDHSSQPEEDDDGDA